MKRFLVSASAFLFAALVLATPVLGQKAALIMNGTNPPGANDQTVIDRLEQEFSMETVLIDHAVDGFTKNEILDNEEPDVIIILESTSSGNVTNQLNDREEPILVQEWFLVDDMGFVEGVAGCDNCWGDLGNNFGNQSGETDITIVSDDHPIIMSAGLGGGDVIAVYDAPGRMQWANNLIDAAEILAVATNGYDEDGDGVSDDVVAYVIEPGAELVDGSELAGLRIGCWIHTTGDGFIHQTAQSLDLWDAMLTYALDSTAPPGVCTTPPATATRDLQTSRDRADTTCGGDFKDGDVVTVEIAVAELRAADGDCTAPSAVRVTEQPPAGWAISEISDGGTAADGVITWDLQAADIGGGKSVSYKVTAAAPDLQQPYSFEGDLSELDAAGAPVDGKRGNVGGEDSLLSDPDDCPGTAVIILADATNPARGDQAMIDRIEQHFGMGTVLIDDDEPGDAKIAIIDAEEPSLIFVFESVSSGKVAEQLNDRPEPVILHEPFLYDNMGFVEGVDGCDNCWGDLGNDFGNMSNESDIDIVSEDHPIIRAAGLEGGDTIATFDPAGRLLWGRHFIDEAEILAVATNGYDEDGDGLSDDVTLVVFEEGVELVDGRENAGLRIGGWIHAEGDGFTLLTEEGLALWDACVLYALGKIEIGPDEPLLVRGDADSDGSVSLTDGIVILDWLFQGGTEPACLDAADTDDSGGVVIADAIAVFGWLFSGGQPPAAPAPSAASYAPGDCGVDEGDDGLGCLTPSPKCSG